MCDFALAMLNEVSRRFWAKVDKQQFCWIWKGSRDANGYGRILTSSYGESKAHRFAYICGKGEIPEGMVIDHLCKNKSCVNPGHLEAVSSRINSLRANNSLAYANGIKTHCPEGHPLCGDNLIISKNGYNGARRCKTCKNSQERTRDRAKRPHTGKYLYP